MQYVSPPAPYYPQATYSPYSMVPRLGIFSLLILACGVIAIWSAASPATLNATIPGWQKNLQPIIAIGVGFGLVRAIFRLMGRIAGLAFWVLALIAISGTDLRSLPSKLTGSVSQVKSTEDLPSFSGGGRRLPSPFDDSAYFPAHHSDNIPHTGVPFIDKFLS